MTKLCCRIGSTTKKYDLKTTATKPRLAFQTANGTKYLSLTQGSSSSEMSVRGASKSYYVKTWTPTDPANWNIVPYKGTIGTGVGNTDYGGCAIWALHYEGKLALVIGMMSADKPDSWAKAEWDATKDATCPLVNYDCGTPCVRLATYPFGINSSARYYHAVPSTVYSYLTDTTMLQNKSVSNMGFSITKHVGWGGSYLNTKYSSLPSSKRISSIVATNAPASDRQHYYRIDCTDYSKISMLGESDHSPYAVGKWATRCFMIEYPEVINTGKTPKELLDIWKTVMTNAGAFNTDYGTCYGRNYGTLATKNYVDIGLLPKPVRMTDSTYGTGGCAVWPIYNSSKVVLAAIAITYCWGYTASSGRCNLGSATTSNRLGFSFSPGKYNKVIYKCVTPSLGWRDTSDSHLYTGPIIEELLETEYSGDYWTRDLTETTASTPRVNTRTSLAGGMNVWSPASDIFRTDWYNCISVNNRNKSGNLAFPEIEWSWIYGTEYAAPCYVISYLEFPENGLVGVPPETIMSEWAHALGDDYHVFLTQP